MDRVHAAPAPAVGKRLWSYVRAALFMARNGKRKLLLSMHLLAANKRRGSRAVARAVTNLLSNHSGHHGTSTTAYALALRRRDYEFSCTNSPAAAASSSRRRLAYFPCLGAVAEEEYDYGYGYGGSLSLPDAVPEPPLARIEHYASASAAAASSAAPGHQQEDEEEYVYACASSASASPSPALLLPAGASGEFSVRVSNYSSEDEASGAGGSDAVDTDAEEFIRRFYDQLRRQNTVAMLPYYMQQEAIAAA